MPRSNSYFRKISLFSTWLSTPMALWCGWFQSEHLNVLFAFSNSTAKQTRQNNSYLEFFLCVHMSVKAGFGATKLFWPFVRMVLCSTNIWKQTSWRHFSARNLNVSRMFYLLGKTISSLRKGSCLLSVTLPRAVNTARMLEYYGIES